MANFKSLQPGLQIAGIKLNLWTLVVCWAVIQVLVYLHFGIVVKGESIKYTKEAAYFAQNGNFSEPKYIFYSAYILIRWIDLYCGTGNWITYFIQLFLNLCALLYFFKSITNILESQLYGFFAALILVVCLPWQSWTSHLYTESVFLSLVVLYSFRLLKKKKTLTDWSIAGILLCLLILSRPTGLLFVPVTIIFLWLQVLNKRNWLLGIAMPIVGLLGFYLLLNYAMKGEGEFDFMKPFVEEHIICGVPNGNRADLLLPKEGNSVAGLWFYVTHNLAHFGKLAIEKVLVFFGMVRPHYSTMHNILLQVFFYPIYLAAILGIWWGRKKYRSQVVFSVIAISLFTLTVVMSCDDWLNRFIMPVLPFIILLAVTGIKELLLRIQLSKTNSAGT